MGLYERLLDRIQRGGPSDTSPTSHAMTGRWPLRRVQFTPASVVLKIPPYSPAR